VQFPIVATWRPKDVYSDVDRLDAILEFMRIRSQGNIANNQEKCDPVALQSKMDDILAHVDGTISALENQKGP
jgi:hypothetical protein